MEEIDVVVAASDDFVGICVIDNIVGDIDDGGGGGAGGRGGGGSDVGDNDDNTCDGSGCGEVA